MDLLHDIGGTLFEYIQPILMPFASQFRIIIEVVNKIVKAISGYLLPIFEKVGKVLTDIVAGVMTFTDLLDWIIAKIKYFFNNIEYSIQNIEIFGTKPFKGSAKKPKAVGEFSWEETWQANKNALTKEAEMITDQTEANSENASASSSYSGGGTVNLTINTGTLVGSDGMEEFCSILKDTFNEMGYYGRS